MLLVCIYHEFISVDSLINNSMKWKPREVHPYCYWIMNHVLQLNGNMGNEWVVKLYGEMRKYIFFVCYLK